MIFDFKKKEIRFKIVYYGPALSGKTTNLKVIYAKFPGPKGKLFSIDTIGERTLFFDFLPIEIEVVKGFITRFYVYTVPGQVHYKIARRLVLKGADGIIYVADSQRNRLEDNIEVLQEMYENMEYQKLNRNSTPLLFQYNKRDLQNVMDINELDSMLNPEKYPRIEAIAIKGIGVFKSLEIIIKESLKGFLTTSKVK